MNVKNCKYILYRNQNRGQRSSSELDTFQTWMGQEKHAAFLLTIPLRRSNLPRPFQIFLKMS